MYEKKIDDLAKKRFGFSVKRNNKHPMIGTGNGTRETLTEVNALNTVKTLTPSIEPDHREN